ncbi:unnamed protein product, partial [Ectocarpus sp. 13 AM-2016]
SFTRSKDGDGKSSGKDFTDPFVHKVSPEKGNRGRIPLRCALNKQQVLLESASTRCRGGDYPPVAQKHERRITVPLAWCKQVSMRIGRQGRCLCQGTAVHFRGTLTSRPVPSAPPPSNQTPHLPIQTTKEALRAGTPIKCRSLTPLRFRTLTSPTTFSCVLFASSLSSLS